MDEIRLQKYLANSGICSRRNAEKLILNGEIIVNGSIVTELGTKIKPDIDVVNYNGKRVMQVSKFTYVLLNKPIGYVTTTKEQFSRPTVLDLIKDASQDKLLPVGRLDMYTSGALILTNDGDFIFRYTHPKNEIEKTYNATVRGIVERVDIIKLENGVQIDNYVSSKAKVKILKIDYEKKISRIQIIIHEGKNREVRKMCEAIGKPVIALHRAKIGDIGLQGLDIGKWRYLKKDEVRTTIVVTSHD